MLAFSSGSPIIGYAIHWLLFSASAIAAFLILFGIIFALLAWRRRARGKTSTTEPAAVCRTLADAVPAMIWTAQPGGSPSFLNQRWCDYTGLTLADISAKGWTGVLHPDDVASIRAQWAQAVRTGEPFAVECRIRGKDRAYRWFLGRANPVRNPAGDITNWCGTITDIEDQKRSLQLLEQQVRERTEELAAANTRMQQEMWERDLARKELDEQNERMLRELTERSQRATLLAQMSQVLQSCISNEEAFAAALGFAPRIFPAARGAIVLLNPARSLAEVIGSWAECLLPAPVFEPTACWALRTGHSHLVLAGDPTARCPHAAGVDNTYLCVPILAQGEALGILHFQTTEQRPTLNPAELSFNNTFAGQLGLAIANIRLRDALHTQSIHDPLTGLYNRRYLEEMLEREIRRAVRADQPLAVLMLDLDHFKRFNDTYGHEAGDAVLRATGSFLVNSVRAEDIVCRFGGEEFVVILPTATLEGACSRAERIRAKLRDLSVLHQGRSLGTITVSIGVAALPVHGTSGKDILAAADAALYRAKREGRDRVVTADAPIATPLSS